VAGDPGLIDVDRQEPGADHAAGSAGSGAEATPPGSAESAAEQARGGSRAAIVATGIFASRIVGFLRDRAIAHWFGVGPHADVFRTVLRGPNVLQNLLGEGTVSAAFIPVYAGLLEQGRERDAGRLAGAVFGLLLALAGGLALIGVLLARPIVGVLAPGFLDDAAAVEAGRLAVDRYELTVRAVRIMFPMAGVLVLSAWALGVLNSHRRFLVPYLAPVAWNVAIITALAVGAGWLALGRTELVIAACIGALAGGFLQFGVQLPLVVRVLRGFRLSVSMRVPGVRETLGAFGPVVAGRGVYQLSAWLDLFLGSLLASGAIAALGWAQTLYVLPVSLFGLSVAAAELPELARSGPGGGAGAFAQRVGRSLRQMAFLVLPTAIGYVLLGYLVVGALYRTGSFDRADNWLVYLVLAGYSFGLVATTWSRLLQNAFYALRAPRTPARIAVLRVTVSTVVAVPAMFWLDHFTVGELTGTGAARPLFLGAIGLALGSAAGGWVELLALGRALRRRGWPVGLPWTAAARMAGLALLSALPALALWWWLPAWPVIPVALLVVGLYAAVYLGLAAALGLSEAGAWLARLRRR
jgi:putative peptidoglycan lipid II flippase